MADSVQLSIELTTDKVVGPAKKASDAIDKVAKSSKALKKALGGRSVSHSFGGVSDWKTMNVYAAKFNKSLQKAARADPLVGLDVMQSKSGVVDLTDKITIATAALSVLKAGFSSAAKAAVSFARSVLSAVMATEKFVPAGTEAYAAQKSLMKIANKLGKSFRSVAKDFQSFVDAGVDSKMAKNMIMFRADLEAIAKTPAKLKQVNSVFRAIDSSLRSGKFGAKDFKTLLEATDRLAGGSGSASVGKMKLLAKLSKMTGKSMKQLGSDMSKLPVGDTIRAFQQLFMESQKATSAGMVATKRQMSTISGAWGAFKTKLGSVLTKIGLDVGPSLRKNIIPVIKGMMDALETPEAANAIKAIGTAIKWVGQTIRRAWVVASNFVKGFVGGLEEAGLTSGLIQPKLGKIDFAKIAADAAAFGRSVAEAVEKISELVDKVTVLVTAITGLSKVSLPNMMGTGGGAPGGIMKALGGGGLGATMGTQAVGKSMTDGLVAGIKGGQSSVVSSMLSVVKAAITAARSALGTRSPSKVFSHLGQMSAIGFAQGMESVNAIPSLQGTAQLAPGLGGAASVNQTNVFETSVNEAASAASTAAEIKKQQLLQMAIAFERAALELGVGIK